MAEAESSILIVDDDSDDLSALEKALDSLGCELHTVTDPHEVLPAAYREQPDVVVLDALLPGLSGFDLCKQIKTDSELKGTQVIIITGVYLRQQYRQEALQQFKADGFLTKPFRAPELQRLVVELLAKKTRKPQSSFLSRLGLPSASTSSKKRGFLGRLFGKEESAPPRIAPVSRARPGDLPKSKGGAVPPSEPEPESTPEPAVADESSTMPGTAASPAVAADTPETETVPVASANLPPATSELSESESSEEKSDEAKKPITPPPDATTPEPEEPEPGEPAKDAVTEDEAAPEPEPAKTDASEPAALREDEKPEHKRAPIPLPAPAESATPEEAATPEESATRDQPVEPAASAEPADSAEPAESAEPKPRDAKLSDDRTERDVVDAAPDSATTQAIPTQAAQALDAAPAPAEDDIEWRSEQPPSPAEPTSPAASVDASAEAPSDPGPETESEAPDVAAPPPVAVRRPRFRVGDVPIYDEEDFHSELKRELSKCRRVDRPLTLILIRVNDLNQIVELFGDDVREAVLWHVAEQAMASLREVDLVGMMSSKDLIALTAFASDKYGGGRVVARMRKSLEKNPFPVGEELPPIVPALQFGMSSFPDDGDEVVGLIAKAYEDIQA